MRSHRLSPRSLTPKAAIISDANPTLDHDGFRPKAAITFVETKFVNRQWGDNLDVVATGIARFYLDVEHALEVLCLGHRGTALDGVLLLREIGRALVLEFGYTRVAFPILWLQSETARRTGVQNAFDRG